MSISSIQNMCLLCIPVFVKNRLTKKPFMHKQLLWDKTILVLECSSMEDSAFKADQQEHFVSHRKQLTATACVRYRSVNSQGKTSSSLVSSSFSLSLFSSSLSFLKSVGDCSSCSSVWAFCSSTTTAQTQTNLLIHALLHVEQRTRQGWVIFHLYIHFHVLDGGIKL